MDVTSSTLCDYVIDRSLYISVDTVEIKIRECCDMLQFWTTKEEKSLVEQRFRSRTSAPSIKLPGAPTEQSHSRNLSALASSPSTFPCATRIEPPPGVEEAEKEDEEDEGELADSRCSRGGRSCA